MAAQRQAVNGLLTWSLAAGDLRAPLSLTCPLKSKPRAGLQTDHAPSTNSEGVHLR